MLVKMMIIKNWQLKIGNWPPGENNFQQILKIVQQ